mmetsp:Transcript_12816/g.39407  ORF Transcript_12816/g.39407 Transcript_12816/m.39407 type:complete len:210 (+) Transcript_12816:1973-2602(+)
MSARKKSVGHSARSGAAAFTGLGRLLRRISQSNVLSLCWGLESGAFSVQLPLAYKPVDLCQYLTERIFDICGVQGRCFDEGEVVLLGKAGPLIGADRPEVLQVTLVAHEHNNNVGIRVVPELPQPAFDVLKGDLLRDVIHEEGADSSPIVRSRDRPISLLTSSIPDLSLDRSTLSLDATCGKLHPNGRLGLEIELVSCKPREQVRLSDT